MRSKKPPRSEVQIEKDGQHNETQYVVAMATSSTRPGAPRWNRAITLGQSLNACGLPFSWLLRVYAKPSGNCSAKGPPMLSSSFSGLARFFHRARRHKSDITAITRAHFAQIMNSRTTGKRLSHLRCIPCREGSACADQLFSEASSPVYRL
jgi:hypothetical protein